MIFKALFGRKESASAGPQVGGTKELLSLSQQVSVAPDEAFRTFVEGFGRWWPRERTWAQGDLAEMVIEPKMGGRCIERRKDGSEQIWGKVLAFDRPHHIVIAWLISPSGAAEDSEATASRLDVRFSPIEGGGTNVLLVHRDFFRHEGDWERYRNEMAGKSGWPAIITAYAQAANPAS